MQEKENWKRTNSAFAKGPQKVEFYSDFFLLNLCDVTYLIIFLHEYTWDCALYNWLLIFVETYLSISWQHWTGKNIIIAHCIPTVFIFHHFTMYKILNHNGFLLYIEQICLSKQKYGSLYILFPSGANTFFDFYSIRSFVFSFQYPVWF